MNTDFLQPYGEALMDYYRDPDKDIVFTTQRDDGARWKVSVRKYFKDFRSDDGLVIGSSFGRVLDFGAGVGHYALQLQRKGIEVAAVDFCPQAVEIMKRRGVANAICADIRGYSDGKFDTILALGSLVYSGTLGDAEDLLVHLREQLTDHGQIIVREADVRVDPSTENLAYVEARREMGKFMGESRLRLIYGSTYGEWANYCAIDPETLCGVAENSRLECEILAKDGPYYYARLTKKGHTNSDHVPKEM